VKKEVSRHPKPEMTSSASTSVSTAIAATTTTSTSSSSSDNMMIIIKTKIENATEGLSSNCFNHLYNKVLPASSRGDKENALTICDYISSIKSEINPSNHYRKDTIILLCNLSIFFKPRKRALHCKVKSIYHNG
jgi:hypothetical protein